MFKWHKKQHTSLIWVEVDSVSVWVNNNVYRLSAINYVNELVEIFSNLPLSPIVVIIDDALCPSLLMRNIDIPLDLTMQSVFFSWRYKEALKISQNVDYSIQTTKIESDSWLVVGIEKDLVNTWMQAATVARRSIINFIPRWLWIYNQFILTKKTYGLLLSVSKIGKSGLIGTLIAWREGIKVLRQWFDPVIIDVWNNERIYPTMAYMNREFCLPMELNIWGVDIWPSYGFLTKFIDYKQVLVERF